MKKNKIILLIFAIGLLIMSCAHNDAYQNCLTSVHTYGFWGGLWHGIIAPFDFIGSLIWRDVTMYAPNNNGGWYAFGFLLGIGGVFSSSSRSLNK
jgi:hypothetical protein